MKYLEFENYITKLVEGRKINIYKSKYAYYCRYSLFFERCEYDIYKELFNLLNTINVNNESIFEECEDLNLLEFDFMIEKDDINYFEIFKKEYPYKLISFREFEKQVRKLLPNNMYKLERYAYETHSKYIYHFNEEDKSECAKLAIFLVEYGRIDYSVEVTNDSASYKLEFKKLYSNYKDIVDRIEFKYFKRNLFDILVLVFNLNKQCVCILLKHPTYKSHIGACFSFMMICKLSIIVFVLYEQIYSKIVYFCLLERFCMELRLSKNKDKNYYLEISVYLILFYLINACVYLNVDDFMYGTFAKEGIFSNVLSYYFT